MWSAFAPAKRTPRLSNPARLHRSIIRERLKPGTCHTRPALQNGNNKAQGQPSLGFYFLISQFFCREKTRGLLHQFIEQQMPFAIFHGCRCTLVSQRVNLC
jgi:hypothetical protein